MSRIEPDAAGRRRRTRAAGLVVAGLLVILALAGRWPGSGGEARAAGAPTLASTRALAPQTAARRDSLLATPAEYLGWKYFHVYCFRCHGVDAFGGQLAPDLRHSVSPEGSVTHEVFVTTVKEGRLPKGMPSWKTMLSDEQIEGLYAYLKARSERRLAPGRPHLADSK